MIGEALSRDLVEPESYAHGEQVDAAWDHFISEADRKRLAAGEISSAQASEIMWRNSCERQNAERREAARYMWANYHQGQAQRHRAVLGSLVAYHEQQAERCMRGA
jgi:hypothetical protein